MKLKHNPLEPRLELIWDQVLQTYREKQNPPPAFSARSTTTHRESLAIKPDHQFASALFELCAIAGGCGSSTAPREGAAPDEALTDEQFIEKLAADEATRGAEEKASAVAEQGPEPKITTATFDPLYRAGKVVLGATQSGVTYIKFMELMQGFSTELSIAKDRELNSSDEQLLALYQEAFDAYVFSGTLWSLKIKYPSGDSIPLGSTDEQTIERYHLAVVKSLPVSGYPNLRLLYVSKDSMQREVWPQAAALLETATAVYLGKTPLRDVAD